jgi:hypothetical protein
MRCLCYAASCLNLDRQHKHDTAVKSHRIPVTTLKLPSTIVSKLDNANISLILLRYDILAAKMVRTAICRVDPQKLGKITLSKSMDLIDECNIEYDD